MANTKITELTAVTALAETDVFPVVDVSASSTNKVSVKDLLRNAPDGSASAPSIANAGDQDTGMFFPADNSVGVSTDGTQRLVIDSSGRVGINVANPGCITGGIHAVHDNTEGSPSFAGDEVGIFQRNFNSAQGSAIAIISGTAGTSSIDFGDKDDADVGIIQYGHSDNSMRFFANAGERVRIDSSGRLGLGSLSPLLDFQVVDYGGFSGNANQLLLNNNTYYDSGDKATKTGFSTRIDLTNQDGSIRFLNTSSSSSANAAITLNERLRITSSGNVGIATSAPSAKLHVAGATRLGANDATDAVLEIGAGATGNRNAFIDLVGDTTYSDYGLRIQRDNSGANTTSRLLHRGTGDFRLIAQEAAPIEFWTSNTERLRIDSSGRVGINASSPGRTLDVDGVIRSDGTSGSFELGGNSSTPSVGCAIHRPANNTMAFVTGTSERLRIDSSGNVGIGDTSPSAKLEIRGASTVGTNSGHIVLSGDSATVGQGPQIVFSESGSGSSVAGAYIGHGREGSNSIGFLSFGTRSSSNANDTPAERMRIDSSGRLGIGTSSPSQALDVVTSSGNAYIRAARNSQSSGQVALNLAGGTSGTDWILYQPTSSNDFRIFGNSSDRLTVTSAGNVGIGTTSPQRALVVSDAGAEGFEFYPGSSDTGNTLNHYDRGSSAFIDITTNADKHIFGRADGEKMRIDSSGRLLIGQTSTSAVSTLLLENNSLGTSRQGILLLARGEATPDNGDALGTFVFTAGNHDPAVEINARRDGGTWTAGSSQPTRLEFSTTADGASSPTERMRITSTGQMRLAGAGITFNGDTAAANELDDYEEGTFTPEYAGSTTAGTYTYSNRTGHYTKIGNMVNATIKLTNINTSTAGTGNINITGLPFTSADNSSFACGSVVLEQFNVSASTVSLAVVNFPNTAILTIHETRDNTTDALMSVGDKATNFADIFCTITYRV